MKLDKNDVELFIKAVEEYSVVSSWRKGQCLFNSLHRIFPKVAEEVRTTLADPFYLDERIPLFLITVLDEDAIQIWYQHPISQTYK